jgi:hypothetical protein
MDTAVHKRPDAFWLTISTAGHDAGSLFGKLYADVLEQLEPEHPELGLTVARDEATAFSSTGGAPPPIATPTTRRSGRR